MSKDELKNNLNDRWWRLNNLYWIENKKGELVRFKPNWAQAKLHHGLWYRNEILKGRQFGISTYTAMLILDFSLFDSNKNSGIIDKGLEDAFSKIKKIKIAYDNLDKIPDEPTDQDIALAKIGAKIKQVVTITSSTKGAIEFSNGSSVRAGTSLRGGTLQLLHVSEFSYTCMHDKKKSDEIKTGALNTVSKDCIVIKESTHMGGKIGSAWDMLKSAMDNQGKNLSPLDYKFFFFSWVDHDEYTLDPEHYVESEEMKEYFNKLLKVGVKLTTPQKAWYQSMFATNGYAMFQEYPTTPEEAFQTSVEGALYGKWIDKLRALGLTSANFEVDGMNPLYTSWDIGLSDYMAIWLIQVCAGRNYIVDYTVGNDEDIAYYVNKVKDWEDKYGRIETNFLPHDAAKRSMTDRVTFEDSLRKAGLRTRVVPRISDLWTGIHQVRHTLPYCIFHARCNNGVDIDTKHYISGLASLEFYRQKPMSRDGSIPNSVVHDHCSHGADAFRTYCEAVMHGMVGKELERTKPATRRNTQNPTGMVY